MAGDACVGLASRKDTPRRGQGQNVPPARPEGRDWAPGSARSMAAEQGSDPSDGGGLRGGLFVQGHGDDRPNSIRAKRLNEYGQPPMSGPLQHNGFIHAGEQDNRRGRAASADRLDHPPSAHRGHDYIDHDKVPSTLGEAGQAARAVRLGVHVVPKRGEEVPQNLAHVRVVVDQEYPRSNNTRHRSTNSTVQRESCPTGESLPDH
jgi:hypothetical protein